MYPNNMGIQICRQQSTYNFQHVLVTKCPVDRNSISLQTKESTYVFPLYLYNKADGQKSIDQTDDRTPNLNPEFVKQFSNILKINFINEKETTKNTFAPIDILDYIYSILHSPNYRVKYKEFLKIDFPRVPYPKDADTFWNLVKLGSSLRQIHLLESPLINKFITTYPVNGSNEVIKLKYEGSKVWINFDQYFDHVPQVAWEFYIGGYQPAQKWLKDRKGRVLSYEDIQHYQRIIVALAETDRLMKEIDKIEFS
jgi:predicted helicase